MHKGFKSQIVEGGGTGQFLVMFPVTEIALLSGSSLFTKCSLDIYLRVLPDRTSVHCVLLAGILHGAHGQGAEILHWENPQRDISEQRFALIIRQQGPRLIDALSSPEVSW